MEPIREFFAANDYFAKHVGIEIVKLDKGYAKVKMPIEEHHLNGVKTVHGGAIFTLADFAFAVAANSHGRKSMGINASIVYTQAVGTGTLFAEAKEISLTHKLGNYTVAITDDRNSLVATFQGTVYRKSEEL